MTEDSRDLRERYQEAESTLEALRSGQVDAVVGRDGVSLVRLREVEQRLREAEEALRAANQDLERRVAERTAEVRLLASRLTDAQDEERRRIAAGLHDEVCQLVYAGRIKLAEARECEDKRDRDRLLDEADHLFVEAGDEIRGLTFELSSSALFEAGFVTAARDLCAHMTNRHGIRFECHCSRDDIQVPDSLRLPLYNCLRELLYNVVKHAGVDEAAVRIEDPDHRLRITVRDHGKGFDAARLDRPLTREGGFGLHHVRERLRDTGGELSIASAPGEGTTAVVQVGLPLDGVL